ncbi:hypothetical protein KHA90_24880 [Flavobacterium psychroterrae]|uniref:Uncharacterized protein n=1 Tax=Flavobacterium psychroterrae TaxID=2133767 RepID=A0ABS5PJF6_9FLAO|nr:hypothetical protein [Flavobacterium psychroterrae]MBS7234236.1 hypothetical protein [Flavobacterium psychroterrae]
MTSQQIKNKIAELELWLRDNPNHPDRATVQSDLRRLNTEQLGRNKGRDQKFHTNG